MTRLPIYVIIAIMVLAVTAESCSPKVPDPGVFTDIDPDGWPYGESLSFSPGPDTAYTRPEVIPDSTYTSSELVISIRHTDAYPYANLWLELSYPSDDTVIADTLSLNLADRYGKWHGNGLGPSYQFSDTVITSRRINDNPTLRLRHIMRVDTLREIEQVGLRILSR